MKRVAVTGVGAVTPLGHDVETFWQALCAGKSGARFIDAFETDRLRSDIHAGVVDFDASPFMSKKELSTYGRVSHLSLGAASEAVRMALLETHSLDPTRIGCLMSTGQGAVDIFEEQIQKSAERGPRAVSPFFVPAVMPNNPAALVSMRYGFMGPSYGISSACATGTHSIATSALMILSGEADIMIAGGAEAATRLNTVAGFGNARALARSRDGDPTTASRPFDVDRQGFVMGEGAGCLVLEDADHAQRRGVEPLAFISGWGMTSDGQHLTQPHVEGKGVRVAIERALSRAGVETSAIDYINPHATSTKIGDVAEIRALEGVFGDRLATIPMSATKSMIGHLLGAAGAVESIAVICSLRDQKLHPSINVEKLDPELGTLDVVRGAARSVTLRHVLKISAGFGGHNCALVLSR